MGLKEGRKSQSSRKPPAGVSQKELIHGKQEQGEKDRSQNLSHGGSCIQVDKPIHGEGIEKSGGKSGGPGTEQPGEGVIGTPCRGKIDSGQQKLVAANGRHSEHP